jgi:hypothetical protein
LPTKDPKPEFKVGDKIRVNLHHGKIEDAVVRAVIHDDDGVKMFSGVHHSRFDHAQSPSLSFLIACRKPDQHC